jgi:hypothetical protein
MKTELMANLRVRSGVQEESLSFTEDQINAVDYLAVASTSAYVNIVSIPFSDQIFAVLQRLSRMNLLGMIGLILLDAVCVLIILLSGKKMISRRRKVECLMNSAAGSILMIGVPVLWLNGSSVLKRISLSGRALYYLMQRYIESVTWIGWVLLGIMTVVWLCGLLYRQAYIVSKRNGRKYSL